MSRPATPSAFNLRRQPLQSGSGASSRAGTPLASKPLISLEEWESKAPLSDEQVQSISAVKDKFSQRPMPEKVSTRNTTNVLMTLIVYSSPTPSPRLRRWQHLDHRLLAAFLVRS